MLKVLNLTLQISFWLCKTAFIAGYKVTRWGFLKMNERPKKDEGPKPRPAPNVFDYNAPYRKPHGVPNDKLQQFLNGATHDFFVSHGDIFTKHPYSNTFKLEYYRIHDRNHPDKPIPQHKKDALLLPQPSSHTPKPAEPFVLLPLAPEPQSVADEQPLPPEDGELWIYREGKFSRHR